MAGMKQHVRMARKAIDACGGPSCIAKTIGCSKQLVDRWRHMGVGLKHIAAVSEMSGVPIADLVPVRKGKKLPDLTIPENRPLIGWEARKAKNVH